MPLLIPLMILLAIIAGASAWHVLHRQEHCCPGDPADTCDFGGPPAETFEGTPARGRLWLDLSEAEYERLRAALGDEWEWRDGVRMRFAGHAYEVPQTETLSRVYQGTRFGDKAGFDLQPQAARGLVQRVFPLPYASGPWAHDAIPVLLPRELIVDLGEFRDLVVVEVDRIPGGTLGGPAGIVAHGIQRILRDACAGAGTEAAEERLAEWYAGVRNVRRRHTGGRPTRRVERSAS